jgi:hypothetical protein
MSVGMGQTLIAPEREILPIRGVRSVWLAFWHIRSLTLNRKDPTRFGLAAPRATDRS